MASQDNNLCRQFLNSHIHPTPESIKHTFFNLIAVLQLSKHSSMSVTIAKASAAGGIASLVEILTKNAISYKPWKVTHLRFFSVQISLLFTSVISSVIFINVKYMSIKLEFCMHKQVIGVKKIEIKIALIVIWRISY